MKLQSASSDCNVLWTPYPPSPFARCLSPLLLLLLLLLLQVIRSRLQQRAEGRALVYTSSWQAVRLTWQREGLPGFYKGLAPSLMRVMPQSAITLMVYEGLVRLLDEQFGGSSSRDSEDADQPQQQQLAGRRQHRQQQRQHEVDGEQQQQQRRRFQWQRPWESLTDKMTPLIIADSQAEQ
jgi:hypothetical protein